MNKKQNFNKDEITLEFLEAKLRSIGTPKAPVTLKDRLLDNIPRKPKIAASAFSFRQKFGIWKLSASAGIFAIIILIITLNFGPSIHTSGSYNNSNIHPNNIPGIEPPLPLAGSNDIWDNFPNDLNIPFIEDINLAAHYKPHWNAGISGLMLSK